MTPDPQSFKSGKTAGQEADYAKMAEHLKSVAPIAVIFDTTSSEPVWSISRAALQVDTLAWQVSDMYESWLKMGVHVITPNKKVGSGPINRYKSCMNMQQTAGKWGMQTRLLGRSCSSELVQAMRRLWEQDSLSFMFFRLILSRRVIRSRRLRCDGCRVVETCPDWLRRVSSPELSPTSSTLTSLE